MTVIPKDGLSFRSRRAIALTFAAVALIAAAALPSSASAQATRTWVSGVGDDANPCSRTAPCKTFAGAISKTATGGIINVLDPGGFGALTITKSITISAKGNTASMLASGGINGVNINAPTNANVTLDGLNIEGNGTTLGFNGVRIIQAGSVRIQNTDISRFSAAGVSFVPTNNNAKLIISNANIYGNGTGVQATPTLSATTTIKRSEIDDNTNGVVLTAPANGARMTLYRSALVGNGLSAVKADGGAATIRVSDTDISENGTGIERLNNGQVISFGNNRLDSNNTNGTFSSTVLQQR